MNTKIKRKSKKIELSEEEKKKLEDQIKEKVEKLIEPRMSGISYHCEGTCMAGCGSEVGAACPPCNP